VNLNPFDHKLVPDWRECWRWASVQLAALLTLAVTGLLATSPLTLLQILAFVPAPVRALIGVTAFLLWLAARLWKQRHPGASK